MINFEARVLFEEIEYKKGKKKTKTLTCQSEPVFLKSVDGAVRSLDPFQTADLRTPEPGFQTPGV